MSDVVINGKVYGWAEASIDVVVPKDIALLHSLLDCAWQSPAGVIWAGKELYQSLCGWTGRPVVRSYRYHGRKYKVKQA